MYFWGYSFLSSALCWVQWVGQINSKSLNNSIYLIDGQVPVEQLPKSLFPLLPMLTLEGINFSISFELHFGHLISLSSKINSSNL